MTGRFSLALVVFLLLGCPGLRADPVHVVGVEIVRRPYGRWEMILSLEHEDTGRDHFCDRVEALDQDGKRIFVGYFYSPIVKDVEEDGPLRRRLRPMPIPEGVIRLTLRAHCKRTGWGGQSLPVDLARTEGVGYRISSRQSKYLANFEGIDKSPKVRTWRKRYLRPTVRWPHPPRGPIPSRPPEPLDTRPQARNLQKIVRWPPHPAGAK
jgi:hypothetical protein